MSGGRRRPPRIVLDNLTIGYERRPAVHHLTGVIEPGDLLAICGPNGAGKSTLLKALAGLLRPLGGALHPCALAAAAAYLPQIQEIDRSFPIDLQDFVGMGSLRRIGIFGRVGRQERECAAEAIAAVGLAGFEDRLLDTLSGGQAQRAFFARLIVEDADVILLDEPFAAVDERTCAELLQIVDGWRLQGRTVVAVLHDHDIVRRLFPKALLLAREPIFWGESALALAPEPLSKARAMIEAHDRGGRFCDIDNHVHASAPPLSTDHVH